MKGRGNMASSFKYCVICVFITIQMDTASATS